MAIRRNGHRSAARKYPRLRTAASKLLGFSSSTIFLAVTSFAVIPAMIAASGKFAWGAVSLGQSIGAVTGVVVLYGWGLIGPAIVAGASPTARRVAYAESVVARFALWLPFAAIAAISSAIVAPDWKGFAAASAVSTTSIGLSSGWYFIGVARPYAFLVLETLPRAGGAVAGIALMSMGRSALAGVVCIFIGMVVGIVCSAVWILWSTKREGAISTQRRPIRELLLVHRRGIIPSLGLAAYEAVPIMIISVAAPAIQPAFALATKIATLATTGLKPLGTVIQAWVLRPAGAQARGQRARTAVVATAGASAALASIVAPITPLLRDWLGQGQIALSLGALAATSAYIGVYFFKWTLERAVLVTFDRSTTITRAVAICSITGLPLVALGGVFLGVTGGMTGVLAGLIAGTAYELCDYVRNVHRFIDDWQ